MTLSMHDEHFVTLRQLEAFTSAAHGVNFIGRTRKEKYAWIEKLLSRFFYFTLRKRDKTTVRQYLMKMTGYEDAQVTRLIRKKKKTRQIVPSSRIVVLHFRERTHQKTSRSSSRQTMRTDDCQARRRKKSFVGSLRYSMMKDFSASKTFP